MLRRLILMRHAKAAWLHGDSNDHGRPLDDRGRRDAPKIAERLVTLDWRPNVIVSSDAERTRQTHALMQACCASARAVTFTRDLYLAGIDEAVSVLSTIADDVACVLLLGHNPGWEDALAWFSGQKEDLGTANAALLECDATTWAAAVSTRDQWSLVRILRPRDS